MQEKSEIVKSKIEAILKARGEFFAELDKQVPKIECTDVFDFSKCENGDLKVIYAKFYAYDYGVRKLLPDVYEAYGVKFNV
ncbi:CmeU family protein [Campylobacter sp. MOP7]|uniref:CmeU family protein n=1 Tax=Campylobacter canis TaxID=3378588 RepID=UPI00387EC781